MIDWYQVHSEQVQTLNQYRLGTMRGSYGEGEREQEGEGKLRNVSLAAPESPHWGGGRRDSPATQSVL